MRYARVKIIVVFAIAFQVLFAVLATQTRAWYWFAAIIAVWIALIFWSARARS